MTGLLQSCSQELCHLEEQKKKDKEVTISDSPSPPPITDKHLNEVFSVYRVQWQDDVNFVHSSKFNAALRKDCVCYMEFYRRKKVAIQSSLESFFKEPGPSISKSTPKSPSNSPCSVMIRSMH
jgi:hypothetical protein